MQFSLHFFSGDDLADHADKYQLLIECAKFADKHDFTAVWIPERHFNKFGGLYPNPAIIGAALAVLTERIRLRAGSVILPLHNPIRVAEEWSIVDNLSKGRVDLCFAAGFHHQDFVLAPELFSERKAIAGREVRTVTNLWRGSPTSLLNGAKELIDVNIFPRPVQPELPTWIACRYAEVFEKAGALGAGTLAALLNVNVDQLAERIDIYHDALVKNGHALSSSRVALMLHTYLGDDIQAVKEKARRPFYEYIRSYVDLVAPLASSFKVDALQMSDADKEAFLAFVYERYFNTSSLIGTVNSCLPFVRKLESIGVTEIACLVDFGLDSDSVLQGLEKLVELKTLVEAN
jgi:natural product biosynthesis luciferase-like monooxygenase protein